MQYQKNAQRTNPSRFSRRSFLRASTGVLAGNMLVPALSSCASHPGRSPRVKKPNVVFFLIDDMGWKDLGCFGAILYETPNIDKVCAAGMRFPQAYTSTSICAPARATALTGIHPVKLHMWNHLHYIPKEQKILPEYLKQAGYKTWHVGKWHLGNFQDNTMPTDLGFDVNRGGWISWSPGSFFWPYGCDTDGKPTRHERACVPNLVEGGREGEYLTDRLTNEAISLIDQSDPDRPFFLNMWYYAVHNPKEAKPEWVEKYTKKIEKMGLTETYRIDPETGAKLLTSETNAVYAAMIESVDESVGRVVEKLKASGQYDNTLFVFYSDNGPTTNDVPCVPLNGGKNSTYEAGERVPAFAVWPGQIKPESQYNNPIWLGDVFDTICEAAGAKVPASHHSDGMSLLPVFAGKSLPDRQFIWYFPDSRGHWAQRANAAIYDQKCGMKYIMFFNGDEDELYDIHNDLAEAHNILTEHPEIVHALKTRLVSFLCPHYEQLPPPPEKYRERIKQRLLIN